jgi:hypothetical protein
MRALAMLTDEQRADPHDDQGEVVSVAVTVTMNGQSAHRVWIYMGLIPSARPAKTQTHLTPLKAKGLYEQTNSRRHVVVAATHAH